MSETTEALRDRKRKVMARERERLARIAAARSGSDAPHCLHCGSAELSVEGSFDAEDDHYQVYGCGLCGLSQLDRQPALDEIADMEDFNPYYQDRTDLDVESEVRAQSFILDLMDRYVPKGRLLEVGCSHGYKLEAARRAGWEVEGVELSPRSCAFARDVLGLPVHQGTIESYLPRHPFDAIVAWHVLEHVPSVYSFLAHLRAFLEHDGYAFVQVPSYARYRPLEPWTAHVDCFTPCHLWYFTTRSLEDQMRQHDLEPAYTLDDDNFRHLTVIGGPRARSEATSAESTAT